MSTTIARTFEHLLATLRFGTLSDELGAELRTLVDRCAATGRPGELKLTIKIKPGKSGQLEVLDDYQLKLPKPERGTTLMFATPEGALSRTDPRQGDLDLREVRQPAAEPLRQAAQS